MRYHTAKFNDINILTSSTLFFYYVTQGVFCSQYQKWRISFQGKKYSTHLIVIIAQTILRLEIFTGVIIVCEQT